MARPAMRESAEVAIPIASPVDVDHHAAGRARIEGEVEADVVVEAAAAPGAPFAADGADDAHGGIRARNPASGRGPAPRLPAAGGACLRQGEPPCFDAQHRDIGAGVAAGEGRGDDSSRRGGSR